MVRLSKPDSIVGFVTGPSVSIWFLQSLITLFKNDHDERFGASWIMTMGPYIHQNRNQVQNEFLQTDREWLMMIDNDIVFEPDDVRHLHAIADEKGPGVYHGPYVIEDGTMVCGTWALDRPMVYHRMGNLPAEPARVGMVGMGFTLIHREVFSRVGMAAYAPLSPVHGEDVSFCWRCYQADIPVWVEGKAQPGHAKQVVVFPDQTVRNIAGDDVNLVAQESLRQVDTITEGTIEGGET
jgi:hypothetical protein